MLLVLDNYQLAVI